MQHAKKSMQANARLKDLHTDKPIALMNERKQGLKQSAVERLSQLASAEASMEQCRLAMTKMRLSHRGSTSRADLATTIEVCSGTSGLSSVHTKICNLQACFMYRIHAAGLPC